MRMIDENENPITSDKIDLQKGYVSIVKRVKVDAPPIDNIVKFAWADEDLEDVQMYIRNRTDTAPDPQSEIDEILIDQEYRLSLIELAFNTPEVKR